MKKNRCQFTEENLHLVLKALGREGSHALDLVKSDVSAYLMLKVEPNRFHDWREFFAHYQSLMLLRKYEGLDTGLNTRDIALAKFIASEDTCRETNHRLMRPVGRFADVIHLARHHAGRILRDFSWDYTLPYLAHGPGATNGSKREYGHPWYKFGHNEPTATGELVALDMAFTKVMPDWNLSRQTNGFDRKIVAGSYVTTVPKDARSDRIIAVEPLLNMFYQKGIGGLMRSRLRKAGCNLNDQTRNQELSKLGSIDGSLATLDLSSASDSVSRRLVELIAPTDWYDAMSMTRCKSTVLPNGENIFLQKFSSMGNGFTFELESLIFLSLIRAVLDLLGLKDHVHGVYGDDLIVPVEASGLLIEVLSYCGFATNKEKSFVDGPFRESCGKHYFRGHDVTPFYAKVSMASPDKVLYFANSVRRLGHRFSGGFGCDDRFQAIHQRLVRSLGKRYQRLSVPEGYGDGGVLRDFDDVAPSPRRLRGWVEGFTTRHVIREYGDYKVGDLPSLCRLHLHLLKMHLNPPPLVKGGLPVGLRNIQRLDHRPPGFGVVPGKRFKLVERRLEVRLWPNLGPWVSLPLEGDLTEVCFPG